MAELRRGPNHLALSSGRSTRESSRGKTVGPDDPHLRGIVLLLRLGRVPSSYCFPLGRYPDSHNRERACSNRCTHTGGVGLKPHGLTVARNCILDKQACCLLMSWERTTSAWLMYHEHAKRGEIRENQTLCGVRYLSSHSRHKVGL